MNRQLVKKHKASLAQNEANMKEAKSRLVVINKREDERRGPDKLTRLVAAYKYYGRKMPYIVQARQVRWRIYSSEAL